MAALAGCGNVCSFRVLNGARAVSDLMTWQNVFDLLGEGKGNRTQSVLMRCRAVLSRSSGQEMN